MAQKLKPMINLKNHDHGCQAKETLQKCKTYHFQIPERCFVRCHLETPPRIELRKIGDVKKHRTKKNVFKNLVLENIIFYLAEI